MATVVKSDRITTITPVSATAGPFDIGFRLLDVDAVRVYVDNEEVLGFTLTASFLDGYDDNATITLNTPTASVIRIEGYMPADRQRDLVANDPNLTHHLNIELARHAAMLSEMQRETGRSIRTTGAIPPFQPQGEKTVLVWEDGKITSGPVSDDVVNAEQRARDAAAARDKAREWAEAPGAPAGAGTKSAKSWAERAEDTARLFENSLPPLSVGQFATAEEAIEYARLHGRTMIQAEGEVDLIDGEGRSNVIFQGGGEIAGANTDSPAYRRQVIPPNAPTARAFPDCWLLADMFPRTATVRVVVVGDSLTTYAADALTAQDGLTIHLEQALRRSNPGRKIEVISRGIGAQRFTNIDALPSLSYPVAERYPWYDDDQRPWLDYVEDLGPHIVVLSCGMNDQAAFDRAALESVVSKIEAMSSRPQIVIATNMVPNLSPRPESAAFGSYAGQEGRDYVAGYLRSYAAFHGYSLIDINRTFGIVRDGRDICDTYFEARPVVVYDTPTTYMAPEDAACRDFTMRAIVDAGAWPSAPPFSIVTSPATNGRVFVDDNSGFLRFRFYRGGVSSNYDTVVSDIPTPEGVVEVEITLRGSLFSFRVIPPGAGNHAGVAPFTRTVIRHGGLFRPRLQFFSGGGTGPALSVVLGVGKEQRYLPSLTDHDLWGDTGGNLARAATGGNGINHPTSRGAAGVYGTHFSAQIYPVRHVTPYQIGAVLLAALDGSNLVGAYNVVDGPRLKPASVGGTPPGNPGLAAGTRWAALGAITGTAPDERITLWMRIS